MDDLRTQQKPIKFNIFKWYSDNKKIIRKYLVYIIIGFILIKPIPCAIIISDWVNNFIGTLISTINI